MKITGEQAREIVWHGNPEWIPVGLTKRPTNHGRWSVSYEEVFEHKPSGKFYLFEWTIGATESQDESPFEYTKEYEPIEVEKREVTREQWCRI